MELKAKPGQEGTAPQQVEWVAYNRNVLDLETGEHHIEPLSQEHLKSLKVTRRGQSATDGKVSAGALNIEAKGESLVAEVKPRTRKTRVQSDEDSGGRCSAANKGVPAASDAARTKTTTDPRRLIW